MDNSSIVIRGAREHNLRNVNLDLPRNRLIVFTGVSGSGKSSLAFDTLYAEGQRRYVESLSSYARQFLGQLPKPDVDYLAGLSPAISIQQKTAGRNPRSTVGTITEVYDYFRVLYARIGQGHCPVCDRPITAQTREQILGRILTLPEGSRFLMLAPLVRGQKGEFKDLFQDLLKRGFIRARVDGQVVQLTDDLKLDRRIKHDIGVVVDRLKVEGPATSGSLRPRLAEAVEQALNLGEGSLIVAVEKASGGNADKETRRQGDKENGKEASGGYDDILLSAKYACTHCNVSYEPPSPQMFSFNSPAGMCPDCDGLGTRFSFAPDLLIPDPKVSFAGGAIPLIGPFRGMGRWRRHIYEGVADALDMDLKTPWQKVPAEQQQGLLYGTGSRHITWTWKQRGGAVWKHGGTWEGIIPQLLTSFKKTAAGPRRMQLEKYMRVQRCPTCHGQRLNAQARSVRVGGKTLVEVCELPIGTLVEWLAVDGPLEHGLSAMDRTISNELFKEIRGRLGFLTNVGLHYLTLGRSAPTLSGGEAQRIRLAGQIGCGLVGVLYILDEPSIGLHPRDNDRLLRSLERLRDLGNTVVVVEHDEDTMRAADYLVDFGPGPGVRGGEVVAAGTYAEVAAHPDSLTAQYLTGRKKIEIPATRRPGNGKELLVKGARHHNLKNIDVAIPLGRFVGVTGVSGSGKSSLVNDIILEGLRQRLGNNTNGDVSEEDGEAGELPAVYDGLLGAENLDKVIAIDQSAIGRTPRSNPATYIKVFDEIRALFAEMADAKVRGYAAGRFSFNKPGGRCEACEGNGSNRLEMDFLADVWLTCPVCEGRRFNRETLQVRFKGKNIFDVLNMDVQEALELFRNVAKVRNMLQTLHDVGLDYIKLGQASPTLSGGEAQRIKLARELCRRSTGKTLYVLDEPTTGLHFEDIFRLLQVLHGFVDAGNTVLVIEHNLDVLKTADWIIDLGPEGGSGGGEIVCSGTPETVAAEATSYTGQALKVSLSPVTAKTKAKKPKARRTALQSRPDELDAKNLIVQGAEQHNLKHVSVELPREKMTVCCGPSGSGKSSLALDTIYAEGQRRYIESLSSYARQFLGQMEKPRVESVSGLSPAISIEQKTTTRSPRSTVGTVTEVYDYLRILYARLGQPYCPKCQIPVGTQTVDEVVDKVMGFPEGTKLYLMAPIERRGQEKYEAIWDEIRRTGFIRMRVNGQSYTVDDPPKIDHRRKHNVEIVVDRTVVRQGQRGRIADAIEKALSLGEGVMHIAQVQDGVPEPRWPVERFSQHFACSNCGRSFEPLNPHNYSFNSSLGWCPTCEGLGTQLGASPALVVRDPGKSLREGALAIWPMEEETFLPFATAIAGHLGISLDTPFEQLPVARQHSLLYGTGDDWLSLDAVKFQYKGLFPALHEASKVSSAYRQGLEHLVSDVACTTCHGSRLRDDAAATRFAGHTLGDLGALPLAQTLALFKNLKLAKEQQQVAGELLREVVNRVQFLVDVGLDYLTLNRSAPTLSGGESQRIRLASQIGSGLTGVLYVLDEPTIGLHPRDNRRLLQALNHLRDLGNTLVVVEHDREVIANADYLLDFGPGAGDRGGEITARGEPAKVKKNKASLTGQYLSGKKAIAVPSNRRIPSGPYSGPAITVVGARHNNLKNIDVAFPLGAFVAVTGVSGSGKSSLVHEILYNTLARKLHRAQTPGAAHDEVRGLEQIDKVISVDQGAIGNSPSSNPATYTGVFDLVRQLFAQLPESKIRGYQPKRFSFNKPGGRCEACEGNGQKKIEMHFLPDVWVECDTCHGSRYNPETLAVRYKGKSIADVLQMRVSEALELFGNVPKVRRVLQTLADVGLDYLALGQPAPTLSGGEAQRVKLAAELGRPTTGRTFYLLDEPTTGLHFDDVAKLLEVLNRLVDLGNTVLVVEHNLDVIKTTDWIIDLGPEAGGAGGRIVAQGTPEDVVQSATKTKNGTPRPVSHTALMLKEVLEAGPHIARPKYDPFAAEAARPDDVPLEAIGQDAKMPWETNGRRWHTVERVSHKGAPCKWEGEILNWVDQRVHELGEFGETNWGHRSVVEIAAPNKSDGWFLHAMTGGERLLRLAFRVKRNEFAPGDLRARLGIRPLNELEGLDVYGDDERVKVANRKGPWQEVAIMAHRLSEVDTPAFRAFLEEAIASFQGNLKRLATKVEDFMPWKINGERWHLGEKGFPPGKPIRWDRSILPRLLELVREVEPKVEVRWDSRDHVALRVPGFGKSWAYWRTKEPMALVCRFFGKKGQFNLAQVEGLGAGQRIDTHRADADVLWLPFRQINPQQLARLKELLAEHLRGFREWFGK
jgi:excinuclease ABC subunit A